MASSSASSPAQSSRPSWWPSRSTHMKTPAHAGSSSMSAQLPYFPSLRSSSAPSGASKLWPSKIGTPSYELMGLVPSAHSSNPVSTSLRPGWSRSNNRLAEWGERSEPKRGKTNNTTQTKESTRRQTTNNKQDNKERLAEWASEASELNITTTTTTITTITTDT